MNLELFGFVKRSAAASSSASPLGSDITNVANNGDPTTSRSKDQAAPPSKNRRLNSERSEGRMWLKHNRDNDVMFCEWCHCFNRNIMSI